jgi:hypothetical protein
MAAIAQAKGEEHRPRNAASGVLHAALLEHLETFLARVESDAARPGLPRHVERELRAHLSCGVLAHGFCRFHCFACGADLLVPFSCKGRGFCPSCGGRRMAESAAHLVDHVLPEAPVRQWVISFPWRLRYLLAMDTELCRAVRRIFLRAVFGYYRSQARVAGVTGGRTGAVNQIQRFGSALNLNPHFHALVLDGVYTAPDVWTPPSFQHARPVTSADVAGLVFTIRSRVLRLCRRLGLLGEEGELEARSDDVEQGLLPHLSAASIQGRSILGEEPGARVARLGVSPERVRGRAVVVKELCAELDGFSLHAAVRVEAQERSRLEHLCRYIARPPFSNNRLSFSRSGKIVLALRAPFRDGTTHFVFEPLAFLERLAALVPPPRMHQLTYHGVLAPGASWRGEIVPTPASRRGIGACDPAAASRPCARYSWPELMQRARSRWNGRRTS